MKMVLNISYHQRRNFEFFYRKNYREKKWFIDSKNKIALKPKSESYQSLGRLPGTRKINLNKIVRQIGYEVWNS